MAMRSSGALSSSTVSHPALTPAMSCHVMMLISRRERLLISINWHILPIILYYLLPFLPLILIFPSLPLHTTHYTIPTPPDREKLKKKLEESGGLTFQIPQFSSEYGSRRVPTIKKVKVQKEGKPVKIKIPKDKKEKILKKKLTAKMVGESLDLILKQSLVTGREGECRKISPRSPGKMKGHFSSPSSAKKSAIEKVRQSCTLNDHDCDRIRHSV
jgi:hypothetical protein